MMFKNQLVRLLILIIFIGFCIALFKIFSVRFANVSSNQQNLVQFGISIVIGVIILYNFASSHGVKTMTKMLMIWVVIFMVCIVGYAFRFELNYTMQRVIAVIDPAYTLVQEDSVLIARSQDGHFYTDILINNQKIRFLIDTGASSIAISKSDAQKLGINLDNLNYNITYSTANGLNQAARIQLQSLQIGDKIFKNIDASIGKGEMDVSLLGMSVISKFSSFTIDKDILVLKY